MGYRTIIARYVAKWGIARMCLCATEYQEGVSHHFWELPSSLTKCRGIWGIAAIVSQYCAIWGHQGHALSLLMFLFHAVCLWSHCFFLNICAQAKLREAKPGGFQTGGFPTFFRERFELCRGPFRDCSSLVLFIGRERGKRQIRKIPQKKRESPKKDKKRQRRKDKSRSGNTHLKPPRLAALDKRIHIVWLCSLHFPQNSIFAFATATPFHNM